MPSDLELMRMHVEAEFTHDPAGRLVRVNEPNGGPAPPFFLGHTAQGVVRRYRHDVPDAMQRELETAAACRGRGHATAAVATWAAAVRERGAEPLYRTAWQNAASRPVARKLGLVAIGRDLHIT